VGIDKGKLHHWWRRVSALKPGYLFVILVVFIAASVFLLRQNSLGMVERRRAVLTADQQAGDTNKALHELRSYMARHMNTRMSEPIQLSESYERAVKRIVDQAAQSGSAAHSQAYKQAQDQCRTSNTVTYAQCVIEKTSALSPGSDPVLQIQPPPAELFTYQFYSPVWTPDLAGICVLLALMTAVLLIARMIAGVIVSRVLRHHR
jgi:hypothetical protein